MVGERVSCLWAPNPESTRRMRIHQRFVGTIEPVGSGSRLIGQIGITQTDAGGIVFMLAVGAIVAVAFLVGAIGVISKGWSVKTLFGALALIGAPFLFVRVVRIVRGAVGAGAEEAQAIRRELERILVG